MSNTETLTIVTVTYQNKSGLEATAASIESQVVAPCQWVVIDGGSSDGTLAWLQARDCEFTSGPDEGIYDAMDKGLKLSRGKYVLFLHAGDCFTDDSSVRKIRDRISDDRADVAYFGYNLVGDRGLKIERSARPPSYIWHSTPASQQATVYRRTAISHLVLDQGLRICGDYWLAATLHERGAEIRSCPDVVTDFGLGGVSTRQPLRSVREAFTVQRTVLDQSLGVCALSCMRRIFSLLAVQVVMRVPG